jgi:hypothetical protein
MNDAPEVSVVIPTRNRWPLLSVTLSSVLAQEEVALEALVVDDASTDETPERLAEMTDPRVRSVRHERPLRQAAARNNGIRAARGRWLAFIDDDDLWAPRKLRLVVDEAERRDAVIAYSGAVVLDDSHAVIEALSPPAPEALIPALIPGSGIPAGASNVVALAETVRRLGGFDEELSQFSDWDMWLRLAPEGPAAARPEMLVGYVQHAQSILLNESSRDLVREWERVAEKHRHLSEEHGVPQDRAGLSRWMAWGHSRAGRRWRAALLYLDAVRRRPEYGRRESLKDALRALVGTDTRTPPVDASILGELQWLAPYRRPRQPGPSAGSDSHAAANG